jgi:hypothetical protein
MTVNGHRWCINVSRAIIRRGVNRIEEKKGSTYDTGEYIRDDRSFHLRYVWGEAPADRDNH